MMDSFTIIRQHPSLISYVDSLQKANVDALSFYPKAVFEREAEKGRIFLGLLNGEPCGYIYTGSGSGGTIRCHQVCIQYDARRKLYGAQLVIAAEDFGLSVGARRLSLRCGFDLDANSFWKDLGYVCVATQPGGIRRNRTINIWMKQLVPGIFTLNAIEPAVGVQDASYWRKHKKTGIVTQFHRGKSLRDYKAGLISAEPIPLNFEDLA
jgi:hypothetical protein